MRRYNYSMSFRFTTEYQLHTPEDQFAIIKAIARALGISQDVMLDSVVLELVSASVDGKPL